MNKTLKAYIELTKPRITTLVLVTTALGFFLSQNTFSPFNILVLTLLGTALSSGGAATLNNVLERHLDLRMERTRSRVLPSGIVRVENALVFGVLLVLSGTVLLAYKVNLLTGFLALLTAFLYVVVYTPLKRITWLNTVVGAIPGALPPMGGWAAASGNLELGAWILFLILFVWQHPHFYAIAWICREDYERAGFKMLPVYDPDGSRTMRQIVCFSALLIPTSLLLWIAGYVGSIYGVGAILLGLYLLLVSKDLSLNKGTGSARKVLLSTVYYLPALLIFIVCDVLVLGL